MYASITLLLACLLALALTQTPPVVAGEAVAAARIETPTQAEVEEVLPAGETLTGSQLYDRFLKNRRRLRTLRQEGRIISSDPAGNPQLTHFTLHWKDYRDARDEPVDGVYSKTLVRITGPRDIRSTSYLHIHHKDRPDQQFMYSPNRRRISRVHIKGQNIAGTDFSMDDLLVSLDDLEDADYRRLPDETVDGVSCYVVEATMKPSAESRYSRSISYLEKRHYVPLKARYWDEVGVEAKEMRSPHQRIQEFDGAWVPVESTMIDVLEGTRSTLYIDVLDPNPDLDDATFAVSKLEFMN